MTKKKFTKPLKIFLIIMSTARLRYQIGLIIRTTIELVQLSCLVTLDMKHFDKTRRSLTGTAGVKTSFHLPYKFLK